MRGRRPKGSGSGERGRGPQRPGRIGRVLCVAVVPAVTFESQDQSATWAYTAIRSSIRSQRVTRNERRTWVKEERTVNTSTGGYMGYHSRAEASCHSISGPGWVRCWYELGKRPVRAGKRGGGLRKLAKGAARLPACAPAQRALALRQAAQMPEDRKRPRSHKQAPERRLDRPPGSSGRARPPPRGRTRAARQTAKPAAADAKPPRQTRSPPRRPRSRRPDAKPAAAQSPTALAADDAHQATPLRGVVTWKLVLRRGQVAESTHGQSVIGRAHGLPAARAAVVAGAAPSSPTRRRGTPLASRYSRSCSRGQCATVAIRPGSRVTASR